MAPVGPSEEELGRAWDRCLVDTAFKSVAGLTVGTLFSFVLFKKKSWPITLGLGIGLGAGYSNCRHQVMWRNFHHHGPFGGGPHWGDRRPPWMRKDDKKDDKKPEPVEEKRPATEEPAAQTKES